MKDSESGNRLGSYLRARRELVSPAQAGIPARFQSGRASSALDQIRRTYGWMDSHDPGITHWEGTGPDGSLYEGAYTSMAHGWSTGVLPALTHQLLGARPTAPGYTGWEVRPHPGDVTWAHGQLPTPAGPLTVDWTHTTTTFTLTVEAPGGTRGAVSLPVDAARSVVRQEGHVVRDGRRARVVLRTAITTGQYRPGDHLGEVEIAERLSVSRGTVREALRHLQQEGLVTPGARGMLRVSQLTPTEVRELFQVREVLEGLAVAHLIASPKRKQSAKALREALDQLQYAFDKEADLTAKVEADLGFHLLLCELAGNSMLLRTWKQLEGPMRVAIMSAGDEHRDDAMSPATHAPIADAIERGDAAAAQEILHDHMAAAIRRLGIENERIESGGHESA
ncbi:FCD domain-containing protein [Streptomyces kunmingensis]|uniref:FCD domain-containing protein n=1 Tax=Streptomyces kunmingensis TaxID=68225 RepID=A0ABU6CD65_9ACTN|nr:FCD domain-containing protein [Streptomyces kunmingensis]MEB3962664.1 FCD domain-containing protein [Streptomyces kunmingensis]